MSATCLRLLLFAVFWVSVLSPARAGDWQEHAQTTVHMLDYIAVDYPEFVQHGKVLDEGEYKEQLEFAGRVVKLLSGLPDNPRRRQLIVDAEHLVRQIAAKEPGARVSAASGDLRRAIIEAYGLTVAPKTAPDLARGANLYAQLCAGCHGAEGRGDGPAGKGLAPPPANFHDAARMASRSVYGLYNTITLGVGGTGMASYQQLREDERWALAFYVSRFAISETDLAKAEAAWKSGVYGKTFPALQTVVTLSTDDVKARYGADAALAHLWLRAHPHALADVKSSPVSFTVATLRESYAAYAKGEQNQAQQLAVTAYLEGFELIEASLDNVDSVLRVEIEREMTVYRNLLKAGASTEAVQAQMNRIVERLGTAQTKLAAEALSPGATFTASLLILLREGLEAMLVLAAIVTFLVKSGRSDVLPWVHAGWGIALVLGAVTWFVASYAIDISGANRELTEGVTALIAAAMLLYVGLWLHSKAHTKAWQHFISRRVGAALEKRTLWAMAAVSFLAVYRELFEIVLFYQALGAQAGGSANVPLLGGIGLAAMLLAAIGWAIFYYGLRLPIGPFFNVTAILLAALAVIFAGQGVAALQEAGLVGADPVAFVRIPALGVFPTVQTLAVQGVTLAVVTLGFYFARQRRPDAKTA